MPTVILLFDAIPNGEDPRGTCIAAITPSRSNPGGSHVVRFDRHSPRNPLLYLCDCDQGQKGIYACWHVCEAIKEATRQNAYIENIPGLSVVSGGRTA